MKAPIRFLRLHRGVPGLPASEDRGPSVISIYGDTVVGGTNSNAGAATALADSLDSSYITGNDGTFGVYASTTSFQALASANGRNIRSFLAILRFAIDSPGGGIAAITNLTISGNTVAIPSNKNYNGNGVITDIVFGPFTKGAGQVWTAAEFNTLTLYAHNNVAPSRIYKVTVRPTYDT